MNATLMRIGLAAALGLILLLLAFRAYLPAFPRSFSLDVGLLAPLFLIIVLSLALDTSRLSERLSHPWLVALGDASYALYILHVPVRWLFQDLLALAGISLPFQVMFFIYLPLLIVLCVWIFQWLEHPARDWLRANPHVLPKLLLDTVIILTLIRFSFVLRLGAETTAYLRTQTFALRVGVVVFILALLLARYYIAPSWRSLALAMFCGTLTLIGFLYLAWIAGWVEAFPRSILLLIPLLLFAAIHGSRVWMEAGKPGLWHASKLS